MFISDEMKTSLDSKSTSAASTKAPSALRKQARALQTRQLLITSARAVFARDGFEQARIEDIATMSGKTRGAFYANFKDKEDVFFAIFEEDIANDQSQLRPLLQQVQTADERIRIVCGYLAQLCKDRQRTLLNLEFKSYAIRHPRKQKRLANLHASMRLRCALPELEELFPEVAAQPVERRRADSLAISAIIDGLGFNRLFDPEAMDEMHLEAYLQLCVRQVFH